MDGSCVKAPDIIKIVNSASTNAERAVVKDSGWLKSWLLDQTCLCNYSSFRFLKSHISVGVYLCRYAPGKSKLLSERVEILSTMMAQRSRFIIVTCTSLGNSVRN